MKMINLKHVWNVKMDTIKIIFPGLFYHADNALMVVKAIFKL